MMNSVNVNRQDIILPLEIYNLIIITLVEHKLVFPGYDGPIEVHA